MSFRLMYVSLTSSRQWWREISGSFSGMSAPLRPNTTRGFLSVCVSPFEGPDRMLSTTLAFSGRRIPGSGGSKFRFELVAFALANDGSGAIPTVEYTRRLISTIVVFPHFEHLNCTFEWPPNSPSFSKCSVPQWMQAVCILQTSTIPRPWDGLEHLSGGWVICPTALAPIPFEPADDRRLVLRLQFPDHLRRAWISEHISRKELKQDKIKETIEHGAEAVISHKQFTLIVVLVILVAALGYGGWRFYIERQTVEASAAFDTATKA